MAAVELWNTSLWNDINLAAYYRLENISDNTPSPSHDLTNSGSVIFTPVKFNNGANFGTANTNQILSVASNLGVSGANHAATLMWWTRMNTEITSSYQGFCQLEENTTDTLFQIYYDYNSGSRRIVYNRQTIGVQNNTINYSVTLGTTNINHVALTYDGGTMIGFFNGAAIGTLTTSGNGAVSLGNNFIIGRADSNNNLSGQIDDMAVFTRALGTLEVSNYYNGLLGPATGHGKIKGGLISLMGIGS